MRRVEPVEHQPLTAAEVLDLLVRRRRLEVFPGHGFGDLGDGRVERGPVDLAEETLAGRPEAGEGTEPARPPGIEGVDHVGDLDAHRVRLAGAAEGSLVDEGHLDERRRRRGRVGSVAVDVEGLVEERPVVAGDPDPHRAGRRRVAAGGEGVPGEVTSQRGQVGREVGGRLDAAGGVTVQGAVHADDLLGGAEGRDAAGDDREGGLDDHRELEAAAGTPGWDDGARDGAVGVDGGDHARILASTRPATSPGRWARASATPARA